MSREVRKVPADWEHPKSPIFDVFRGIVIEYAYKSLSPSEDYEKNVNEWDDGLYKWKNGIYPEYADDEDRQLCYEQFAGQRPHRDDYMPSWPESECTHWMMYETTSEGTPISPAFPTPEKLAQWLVDNHASACGPMEASYDDWLRMIMRGESISAVYSPETGLISGVQGLN